MSDSRVKCGFIGLGSQGAPIAQRMISAGFPMTLWARRLASIAPFKDQPVRVAESLEDLAQGLEHVGVCVVDDAGVQEVCDELIPSLPRGARIAIHSTIHPNTVKNIARDAEPFGVHIVDAPVSGGEPAAKAGTLTVMVGGAGAAVELARPIFESFGALILHLGEVGAGQNAKLVNNALLAANMASAHEALLAAAELGVDRATIVQLLAASSGRSFGLEVVARMPEPKAFSHGGALLQKDVRLLHAVLGDDSQAAGLWRNPESFLQKCTAKE